jgi:hypothetical protein
LERLNASVQLCYHTTRVTFAGRNNVLFRSFPPLITQGALVTHACAAGCHPQIQHTAQRARHAEAINTSYVTSGTIKFATNERWFGIPCIPVALACFAQCSQPTHKCLGAPLHQKQYCNRVFSAIWAQINCAINMKMMRLLPKLFCMYRSSFWCCESISFGCITVI